MLKKIAIGFISLYLSSCASIETQNSKKNSATSSIIKVPHRHEKESLMGYNPFTRKTQWGTDLFEITGRESESGKQIHIKLKKFLYSVNSLQVEPGNYTVSATCSAGVNYIFFSSAKVELVVKPGKIYFLECEKDHDVRLGTKLHLIEKDRVNL